MDQLKNEEETKQLIRSSYDTIPPTALNHVSRLCNSVQASIDFYVKVLGFVLIHRPPTFDFDGAWLFNYGVGIHLIQNKGAGSLMDARPDKLDPLDNHISFQDMEVMEERLKEMNIKYLKRTVGGGEEEGSPIDQLFFNDPDRFMIERFATARTWSLSPQDPSAGYGCHATATTHHSTSMPLKIQLSGRTKHRL